MSGWQFIIKCQKCGKKSHSYPHIINNLTSSTFILPSSVKDQGFGTFEYQIPENISMLKLSDVKETIKNHKNVAIPMLGPNGGLFLEPALLCPFCDGRTQCEWVKTDLEIPEFNDFGDLIESAYACKNGIFRAKINNSRIQYYKNEGIRRWRVISELDSIKTVKNSLVTELKSKGESNLEIKISGTILYITYECG